jgi:hypothetical protein
MTTEQRIEPQLTYEDPAQEKNLSQQKLKELTDIFKKRKQREPDTKEEDSLREAANLIVKGQLTTRQAEVELACGWEPAEKKLTTVMGTRLFRLPDSDALTRGGKVPECWGARFKEKGIPLSKEAEVRPYRLHWSCLVIDHDGTNYLVTRRRYGGLSVSLKPLSQFYRQYIVSSVPTFPSQRPETSVSSSSATGRDDILLHLYPELCQSWRQLVQVRFSLLGLVPTASLVIVGTVLARSRPGEGLGWPMQMAIAVLGLCITAGLYTYELRNSELHDDLISRGRRIESELGIETGQFRGRLTPSRKLLGLIKVEHDTAIKLIYCSAVGAWLLILGRAVFWETMLLLAKHGPTT